MRNPNIPIVEKGRWNPGFEIAENNTWILSNMRKNYRKLAFVVWFAALANVSCASKPDPVKTQNESKQAQLHYKEAIKINNLKNQLEWKAIYISTQDFQDLLDRAWEQLWYSLKIPEKDRSDMFDILPSTLSKSQLVQIKHVETITKDWKLPIIMQIPEQIVWNWITTPLTPKLFSSIIYHADRKRKSDFRFIDFLNINNLNYNQWFGSQWPILSKRNNNLWSVSFDWSLWLYSWDTITWTEWVNWEQQQQIIRNITWTDKPDDDNAWIFIAQMLKNISTSVRFRDSWSRFDAETGNGKYPVWIFWAHSNDRQIHFWVSDKQAHDNIWAAVSMDLGER